MLTFFPDRIELDGITICGDTEDTMARRILECLRLRTRNNRWKGFRSATLAKEVHATDAVSVARAICTLRAKAKDLLLAKGVRLADQDLIASDGTGYRLDPTIACRDEGEVTSETAASQPDPILPQPDGDPDTVDLNDRQIELLDPLRAGQEMRKRDLTAGFDRIEKTIKRDLDLLKPRAWPASLQLSAASRHDAPPRSAAKRAPDLQEAGPNEASPASPDPSWGFVAKGRSVLSARHFATEADRSIAALCEDRPTERSAVMAVRCVLAAGSP